MRAITPVEIGGLLVPSDRADQLVTGLLTARPGDGHPDPITDALDLHFDPLDQEPDDLLAVGRSWSSGRPTTPVGHGPTRGSAPPRGW